jgi:hypothetical protein
MKYATGRPFADLGRWRTFSRFHRLSPGTCVGMRNDGTHELGNHTPGPFLAAAQQELIAFEQKEQEFRKQDRLERAKKLQLPVEVNTKPS